jgi:phage FluMu protein Com
MPYERARSRAREKIFHELAKSSGQTFTALLKSTRFSRSKLSRYLKELIREGKVEKVYVKEKDEVRYVLSRGLVEKNKELAGLLFNLDSRYIFKDLIDGAIDKSLSDEAFLERYCKKIGVLITYSLLQGLGFGDYEEAKKWILTAVDTEGWLSWWISILAWRLYHRRVLPSFAVEAIKEDRRLLGIGKRYEEMKKALEKLQAEDIGFLNKIFQEIKVSTTGHVEEIKCPKCEFESEYNLREKEARCKKCGQLFWRLELFIEREC